MAQDIELLIAERAVEGLAPHDIQYLMGMDRDRFEKWCAVTFAHQLGHISRTKYKDFT